MTPVPDTNPRRQPLEEAFEGLVHEGSMFCRALCGATIALLLRHQQGQLSLAETEAHIGRLTDSFVARELAGDEPELRLAIMAELDAVRRIAADLLDAHQPSQPET